MKVFLLIVAIWLAALGGMEIFVEPTTNGSKIVGLVDFFLSVWALELLYTL